MVGLPLLRRAPHNSSGMTFVLPSQFVHLGFGRYSENVSRCLSHVQKCGNYDRVWESLKLMGVKYDSNYKF